MLKLIPIEKLTSTVNVRNKRDDEIQNLVDSIRTNGLISPISVRETDNGKYEIVAGHRRYLALKRLNEPFVECNILENIDSLTDVYRVQLAENIQRKDMSPPEYVEMFEKLKKEYKFTSAKLALFLNKSQSWVNQQYLAVKILKDEYGDDGNVPEKYKNKSAAFIEKHHYEDTSERKLFSGKGFTCVVKGHKYQILCTELEFENDLREFLKERGMKI